MPEKDLYRLCFLNNGKPECDDRCLPLKETNNILYERTDGNINSVALPCSNYLPNFIDKFLSVYDAKSTYDKFYPK